MDKYNKHLERYTAWRTAALKYGALYGLKSLRYKWAKFWAMVHYKRLLQIEASIPRNTSNRKYNAL